MRIAKTIAFLVPLSIFVVACSSGGEGTVSAPGVPGGFGLPGSPTPVFAPGGSTTGGTSDGQDSGSTNPGFDTGTVPRDTGSSGPADTFVPPTMYDNYEACASWINTVNALPCAADSQLPISTCTHEKIACNLTSYYGCLREAYICNDSGVLDGSGASACKADCTGK